MQKAIITVVGKDAVGIIAKVCTYLSEIHVNILDISQTITGGYFNMMMIADLTKTEVLFSELREELRKIGSSIGVDIRIQKEEIFDKMHRI
jgi:ACT domain-containing protein